MKTQKKINHVKFLTTPSKNKPRCKVAKTNFDPFKDFVGQGHTKQKTNSVKEIQTFYQK